MMAQQLDIFGAKPRLPFHRQTRGAAREATKAAAERSRPHAESVRARSLAVIRAAGDRGATCDEIADTLGLKTTQVRPRVSGLSADGIILDTGEMRPNADGNPAAVYRAVPGEGAAPSAEHSARHHAPMAEKGGSR